MKRLFTAITAMLIIGAAVVVVTATQVDRFMNAPLLLPEQGLEFEISTGSSFAAVSSSLVSAELISDDRWLRLYVRWHGLAGAIQAGDYLIEPGTTPKSLLNQFTNGVVQLYSFTIVEGWNHHDVLQALRDNEAVKTTMTNEDWPPLLHSLGEQVSHPEGLFLPETYHFPRATTDRELLAQAYSLMQKVLQEEWLARGSATPVQSRYETLILASIIEKETARADERARISGVFARRLDNRMRLQTDPTVIYGIGPDFDGNLTRTHMTTDTNCHAGQGGDKCRVKSR